MALMAEVRQALRGFRQAPSVAIAAVLCLALGLGATVAIYSAVYTALLRPLPFRDPSRLVSVFRTTPQFRSGPFSPANYLDLRREATTTQLVATTSFVWLLQGRDVSQLVTVMRASGDIFTVLGVKPLRGRVFTEADDAVERPPVVVLAESFWRERFGADPAVVGSTVRIQGTPYEVVGIAPASFRVPHRNDSFTPEVWVPLRFDANEATTRGSNYLAVTGRLADGVSQARAEAELRGLMAGIIAENPQLEGDQVRIAPLRAEAVHSVRTPLLLLLGAVAFVLLIAAANVASLLLARGVSRQREVAIRAVLGADGWSVVRPALVEAGVLTAAGTAAGLALAWTGVRVIRVLVPPQLPQIADLSVDWVVVASSLVVALVVALVCGILPAWHAGRSEPQEALRSGERGGTSRRQQLLLRGIVAAEVALSLVLLLGAGLVMRGFTRLTEEDPGFDASPLLTLKASVPDQDYADSIRVAAFLIPALEAIRAVPGVEDAGAVNALPYDTWGMNFNIWYEGVPGGNLNNQPLAEARLASPSYFTTLGLQLLQGHLFDDRAVATSPAMVVVNQALVDRDFPNGDAVGKRFYNADSTFATIVGVVSNTKNNGPFEPPAPQAYWSYGQSQRTAASFPIVVRVRGEPADLVGPIRQAIRSVEPNAAADEVRPMKDVMAASIGQPRFYLALLAIFAAVALLLSMAGLYGVMSYGVAQRTREIGIRMALGSTPRGALGLVLRQGMRLVVVGAVLGMLGSLALTRLLQSLLFGVSPLDALTWLAVTLLLGAVGVAAVLLPARRASSVAPMVAIRIE